ncbi:MAG: alpha/beta fold hydrolase [Pseudomonadota bacterium]
MTEDRDIGRRGREHRAAGRRKRLRVTLLLLPPILVGGLFWGQKYLVFQPFEKIETRPDQFGIAYENIALVTSDGVTLDAWYVPGPEGSRKILFFHGNAGNMSHRVQTLLVLRQLGHSVLIIDYRGYGQSEGSPSESGLYADGEAAWRYLVEQRHTDPEEIVVYGRSLGGPVAAKIAAAHKPRALIVESTFTSMADMGGYHYPYLGGRWLSRYDFDTEKYLNEVDAPILIAASPDDEIVPFEFGQRLLAATGANAAFFTLSGTHNTAFHQSGMNYFRALDRFIRSATID